MLNVGKLFSTKIDEEAKLAGAFVPTKQSILMFACKTGAKQRSIVQVLSSSAEAPWLTFGLYYKHIDIVNDDSKVVSK